MNKEEKIEDVLEKYNPGYKIRKKMNEMFSKNIHRFDPPLPPNYTAEGCTIGYCRRIGEYKDN